MDLPLEYGLNTGKCPSVAKYPIPERNTGTPHPKEVAELLNLYAGALWVGP